MMNEVRNRFAEIGFDGELLVDQETGYFTFNITGRIGEKQEFDYEKKGWEIRRAKDRNENVREIF